MRSKFRTTLGGLWDRYDAAVAYVFIAGFAVLELVTLIVPAAETAIAPQVRLVLLCLGLLTFFRSIESSLGRITARVATPALSDGIGRVLEIQKSIPELIICANDGIKYYSPITEHGVRIASLRILLCDLSLVDRWRSLQERGIVARLEVRVQPSPPIYHLCVIPNRVALFGAFTPRTTGYAASTSLLVQNDSRELRDMIGVYQVMFETAWTLATPVLLMDSNPLTT